MFGEVGGGGEEGGEFGVDDFHCFLGEGGWLGEGGDGAVEAEEVDVVGGV